jgi:malate dehydrogenase (oxaloacetate-decarboxylating)(NADP+)
MADRPLILALANPVPEIMPDEAKAVRPDAVIATGRSDYPNQVNNVLCFPFIFRGALDVGAASINEEMKIACVNALSELAMAEPSDVVKTAYAGQPLKFGPDYLIPKPFDPRLITVVAPAVAKAAMDSGVATRPIKDFDHYRDELSHYVFKSSAVMEPIFERAKEQPMRICYAEGEEERVLQAAQQIVDAGLAYPILIGRPSVIETQLAELGLRIRPGQDFELVEQDDPRYEEYWHEYYTIMGRRGVSPARAQHLVRSRSSTFAALMVRRGDADGMVCGTVGAFHKHLERVDDIIGKAPGVHDYSTLVTLILPVGTYFICDTHVTDEPSAEDLAEMTLLSAQEVRRFGIVPKVALVSHSNFGNRDTPSARKMRQALAILRDRAPELEVDGEMHAEAAVNAKIRDLTFPDARISGSANLLVMPNVDAAHISYTLLKVLGGGVSVGPILVGAAKPAHVVTQTITVRGLINITAMTSVEARIQTAEESS